MNCPRLQVTWPLTFLLVAFPAWWLMGMNAFIWLVIAIPMLVALAWPGTGRRGVAVMAHQSQLTRPPAGRRHASRPGRQAEWRRSTP
jgi:hypothetical protein